MVRAIIQSKKMLIVLGTILALLLAVACSADNNGNGGSGTAGGVSTGDLSNLLASAGGAEALSQLLQGGSGTSTGIWVNGTGEASATPDLGIINLGVEALADSASEARGDAAVAIAEAIAVLKNNNIEDRDIRTSHFNISPRYNTQEVRRCTDTVMEGPIKEPEASPSLGMPVPSSEPVPEMIVAQEEKGQECRTDYERVLIGYQVTNSLSVKVRDLDNMGAIIDGVTAAAGDLTRANGINFTIDDPKPLQAEARKEAIEDMLAKAQTMADTAGIDLGKLVFLTETGGGTPAPFARAESAAFGFAVDQATSIQAGELDVSVSVQGVFDIAPSGN